MAAASSFRHHFNPILLLFLAAAVSNGIEEDELESMLTVLRVRGYALFSNAIATSDVIYEIFNSNSSFTIFAPTDSNLFATDMINTASDYTSVLRCHVVPLRLTLSEIRHLNSGYGLDTLAKNHAIRVESRSLISDNDVINLDGVEMVLPGLFYSRDIAVHGLGGILNCLISGFGSGQDSSAPSEPPILGPNSSNSPATLTNFTGFLEPPISGWLDNNTIESPVPEPAVLSEYSPENSPNIAYFPPESLSPVNLSNNQISFPPVVNDSVEPPLPTNLTEPPTSAWLENHTIISLVPEPAIFGAYSQSKSPKIPHFLPANFCENNRVYPPVVGGSAASPLPTIITGFLQPPTSGCLDSNTIKSPVPEPVDFDGYLPAHSPNTSHLPPANFSGNHGVSPPVVSESAAPPTPPNSTSKWLDNNTIKSPVSEPADLHGYPQADSPKTADISAGYLQAYNYSVGIPNEPVVPEFSDDPMFFPTPGFELSSPAEENDELSTIGLEDKENERESQLLHSISSDDWTEIMEGVQYASLK
ncbi:uncharacterized protein Fot_27785 [Forsythia ovata]|uniref:FAS1 domain-containing protein n=1 Tax=Forsythia ovata TaxID=205694 RepID=A0ABD1TM57_9LAMI